MCVCTVHLLRPAFHHTTSLPVYSCRSHTQLRDHNKLPQFLFFSPGPKPKARRQNLRVLLFPVLELFINVMLRVCLVYKNSFPQSPHTDAGPEGGFGRCFVLSICLILLLLLVGYYFNCSSSMFC